MRIIFLILLFLYLPSFLFAQTDTTYSDLRGMEDAQGNTHLFYRKNSVVSDSMYYNARHDIYHFDINNQSEMFFLPDFTEDWSPWIFFNSKGVSDFEFWNNNPNTYIYGGASAQICPNPYISRFDSIDFFPPDFGAISNIEISQQNDAKVFAALGYSLYKSIDFGYSWHLDSLASMEHNFIALNPFNDQVLFSVGYSPGGLYKSIDGGITYSLVDSSENWWDIKLLFDPDSIHIYAETFKQIRLSHDSGNSWQEIYSDTVRIHLTIDYSISGKYYFGVGNDIFESPDYGNTINHYYRLNKPIQGLYKKPNSDLLYALTSKEIYEISSSGEVILRQLPTAVNYPTTNLITNFSLNQNYPNPFNSNTVIPFEVPNKSKVNILLYNTLGQKIMTIFSGIKSPGFHEYNFNGKNLSSGIYFITLQTDNFIQTKKCLVIN